MQNFGKGKLNNAQYLTKWRIHDKKSGVCGSLNFFCICLRRQDEYMFQGRRIDGDAPLSNQTMEIRRRKREICNRIHNSTWLIETIAILSGGIFQLLALRVDPYIVSSVEDILSLLIYRLLVPFTRLFSENRIKVIVLEQGWVSAIKTALKFKHLTQIIPIRHNRGPMPLSMNGPSTNPSMIKQDTRPTFTAATNSKDTIAVIHGTLPAGQTKENFSPSKNSNLSSNHLPNTVFEYTS